MKAYMRLALNEALEGIRSGEGGPFGAVIVCGGEVIARAHNTVIATHDPTAHAEINAIRMAAEKVGRFHLSDCELYTTCEPCPMCLAAVLWARIPRVYFGCTRDDAGNIGFSDKEIYDYFQAPEKSRLLELIPDSREDCLSAFKEWDGISGKVIY